MMSRKSFGKAELDFRGSSKNYKNRRFFIFREKNGRKKNIYNKHHAKNMQVASPGKKNTGSQNPGISMPHG